METQEQEQYGTNVKETSNSSSSKEELIKTEEIEGTPFTIIRVEGETRIALGQFAVTETLTKEDEKKTIAKIKKTDWNFMLAVLGAITIQTVEQSYVKVHERMKEAIKKELLDTDFNR